ncbi:MAG TPA: amidohydrolase [Acidimicrobiales bacterium]|nr:amidohydrolase [Acidimicrobiales bacterium]
MDRALLFRNGTVLTADPSRPTAHAVAVERGVIVALDDDALEHSARRATEVDLAGGCLVPGFRDGHAHPLWGGIELGQAPLVGAQSIDELLARVKAYADTHPDEPWIEGGGYDPSLLPKGVGDATVLDAIVPDRPVVLEANDHHTMWVNSEALRRAGIDADTPDPALGRILRHSDRSPVGTLVEWEALAMVRRVVPVPEAETQQAGLRRAMAALGRAGITWVQEAATSPAEAEVYAALAARGELTTRANLAFRAEPGKWMRSRDSFTACRDALESAEATRDVLAARTVKFFADGVIEMGTGFLLEPYTDAPHTCGLPNWSPAELEEAVIAFDADGFQIHVHAIGDGGVRMALDAIQAAGRANGPRDRRPVIAHTQVVAGPDRDRFAALGVIANFEPLWACLDGVMEKLTIPRLGPERSALQYPIATLVSSGARISFGSDWPVSSMHPLHGLAVAVTRQNRDGRPEAGWLPEERLPVTQALAAYTSGTAYQGFEEATGGMITIGKRADLCALSADISAIAGSEVSDIAVTGTWTGGREVYAR